MRIHDIWQVTWIWTGLYLRDCCKNITKLLFILSKYRIKVYSIIFNVNTGTRSHCNKNKFGSKLKTVSFLLHGTESINSVTSNNIQNEWTLQTRLSYSNIEKNVIKQVVDYTYFTGSIYNHFYNFSLVFYF